MFVLTHLLYYPTWRSGFVTDFTGLAERIETRQFWDFWNSFGFPSIQPVLNFFLVIFYKGFSTNSLPWYLVFTSFHIANGFMFYCLLQKIAQRFGAAHSRFVAISAACLFLVSPYASEPVTWRASFSYLLVSHFTLQAIWHTINWLEKATIRSLFTVLLFFTLALFTFELSFMMPFIVMSFVVIWSFHFQEQKKLLGRVAKLALPMFGLIGCFFGLQRIILGQWIGHYGADVHLRIVPKEIFAEAFQYLAKLLLFARYFEHPVKETIFSSFHKPNVLYPLLGILLALAIAYILFFSKMNVRLKLAGWTLLSFFFAILPMLNLYFYYILHIENDRYTYLASMFFWACVVLLLSFLPKALRYASIGILLFISIFLLHKTNQYWKESTQVHNQLLSNFNFHDYDTIFLLAFPDNYNGAYLFRDGSPAQRGFSDALRYVGRKPFAGKIHEVAQFNMTSLTDGVRAVQDSTGTIVVTFNQWGNWWWRRGIGLSAYETADYTFETKGQSYELRLKNAPGNAAFIYQDGTKWRQLEISY